MKNLPTCNSCDKDLEFIENGYMHSYWGEFCIQYIDIPMFRCNECNEELMYGVKIAEFIQNITIILHEQKSSIHKISLKYVFDFIDTEEKEKIFLEKLNQKEIYFIKDKHDAFFVDELQLIKLDRYKNSANFNEQIQLAARDGKVTDADAKKIIELLSDDEDKLDD